MIERKSKSSNTLSGGCLSLFGLPFLLAGILVSFFYISGYSAWWKARDWIEVPCWIESTHLKVSHDGDSTTYDAQASYRYEFAGGLYHGDRVSLNQGSDNMGDFQENAHRELSDYLVDPRKNAVAKPFRCYVNPDKPEESVIYRVFRWEMQAFMALFALTFPAVGAGLVAAGLIARKEQKKEIEFATAPSKQPMLEQPMPKLPAHGKFHEAEESIPASHGQLRKALQLYTLWSGLVILPLIAVTAFSGTFQSDAKSLLLFGFVFFWCFPAWFSLRHLRQYKAVGSLRFQMSSIPASPGGVLEGAILFERQANWRGIAELTLTCNKEITRNTGDGESTSKEILWKKTQTVAMNQISPNTQGYKLPISFALPPDAPRSGASDDPKIAHSWKLKFKVAGTVLGASFEIPVVSSEHGEQALTKPVTEATSIHDFADMNLPELLAARKIRADFDRNGYPSAISCTAARYRGVIVSLIIFDLIWTGVAVFLFTFHVPILFRIVWPVSATAIWIIVIYRLLHSRDVNLNDDSVEIQNKIGPWIRKKRFDKSKIKGFSHDTHMNSSNQQFYRVRMEDVVGKKHTLVDGITDSTTAAALVMRFEAWSKSPQSGFVAGNKDV